MIAALYFAAVFGCVAGQVFVCRRFGLRGVAAFTVLVLGGLIFFWSRVVADFPINPCETCRASGLNCGGCERLGYAAFGLGGVGVLLSLTGLVVGVVYHLKGQRA